MCSTLLRCAPHWRTTSNVCAAFTKKCNRSHYSRHIPTNTLQKAILTVGSAVAAISNPARGDMVATMGESSGIQAIKHMQHVMMSDSEGKQILDEQPRISTNTVNLDYLASLPLGSFGREYFEWLLRNKASPDDRLPVQFVDDPDLAYVMTRYRETHDMYHTVLGMPTNMLGEVSVKWVEAFHTRLPMCIFGAVFGQMRLGPKHRDLFLSSHLPWAVKAGVNTKNLMSVYYENYWETSLVEFRQHLGIPSIPLSPERRFI